MIDRAARGFADACGLAGPFLVGVEEPGASTPSWRLLERPFAVIGRDPGSDIFLGDPAVGPRQAYLQVVAGRTFCVDLQGRTGTLWDGEPGLWGWLDPGPGIRVGGCRILAKRPEPGLEGEGTGVPSPALPAPVSRAFEQPGLPGVTLEILGRASGGATWRASRSLILVGRSPSCKIRLLGDDVAEIHASLLRTPAGLFAVDLLGPGGILVNDLPVRSARLDDGDILAIGPHRILVRTDLPGSRLALAPGRALQVDRPPAAGPAALGTRDGADDLVAGSTLRAMLEEFAEAQDRSASRFQAGLVAILQSFAEAHRDQMDLIREELARIRLLTQERQEPRSLAEGRATLRMVAGGPPPRAGRAAVPGPPPGSAGPPRSRLEIEIPPGPPDAPVAPPKREAGDPRATPDVEPGSEAEADAAFHDRIFDRLAEIQGERQGRWRTLIDSVLGGRP